MLDLAIRFLIGGTFVTAFAALADVLRPKSFAGLFGAAPSVALATLVLTISKDGKEFATAECRSMILGSVSFLIYASVVSYCLRRHGTRTLPTTVLLLPLWLGLAFVLKFVEGGL